MAGDIAGVPLVDLKAQYESLRQEIDPAVLRVLGSGSYVQGGEVRLFEQEFATYTGAAHAAAVNSGTSALHLALLAAGIGPGDEVITVAHTFVATVAAILYAGAVPVLVDIDPETFAIDVERIEAAITPRTRAIIPVHLYGHPADMDPTMDIARRHGLTVIEDAAQAHGAWYRDRPVGSIGDLTCFSFYPSKNLGAFGEGGAVTTNREDYDHALRMLRDWGCERKYHHQLKGFNYRLDEIQAAILRVKLRHLEAWNQARRDHAAAYSTALANTGVVTPTEKAWARHVYYVYAVRSEARDELQRYLKSHGVDSGIHYPIPVHMQEAYADLGYRKGDFPHSELAAEQVLSIPLYPELRTGQRQEVIAAIQEFARTARGSGHAAHRLAVSGPGSEAGSYAERSDSLSRPTLLGIKRVALILQSTSLGGMETHCLDLAAELVRRGIDVIVVIPPTALYDGLAGRAVAAGAAVERLKTDGTAGRAVQVRNLLRLVRIFRRWPPDVVHLHTGGAAGGFATMFLARLMTSRATVITEHDVPIKAPHAYQRILRAAMDRSADAIIAVSGRNANLRTERIAPPEHKLAAVLNGVPTSDLPDARVRSENRSILRKRLNIDSESLVIGSLVRLAEGKGLDDLVRAFAIVREHQVGTLLLVGDGPLRSPLESLARDLRISADVRFAGHQVDATRYLDTMDAFVLAVPAGSMSMALLEAMARGLPSVITYCGPEEPIIEGETGLCAPPSDPKGLAGVLSRLISQPELRARLGSAAEAHVMRHFSVERVADDLLELYAVCRKGPLPERLRARRNPGSVRERHPDPEKPVLASQP